MELNPSLEANSYSATQKKTPAFYTIESSLNFSDSSPLVVILSPMNPLHTLSSYIFKI
jgi:hypothetical protein